MTKETKNKVRYIAITDIQPPDWWPYREIDDMESLIRLLLYSNRIDVVGIIPCTSVYKRKIKEKDLECTHEIISNYGKVRDNLELHEQGFPTEDYLHSIVKSGIPAYGKSYGHGFASKRHYKNEGVQLIINEVDKDDARPLWIGLWGGANTLAQAIWQVRQERSDEEFFAFLHKLRIYGISDQDASSKWMRDEFGKDLFYVVSPSVGTSANGNGKTFLHATWPGISCDNFAHGSENGVDGNGFQGAAEQLISKEWLEEHIHNVGPLGNNYPLPVFCMEGDSPSYMGLIANGLHVPERPGFGGWGGRYEYKIPDSHPLLSEEKYPIWTDTHDTVQGNDGQTHTSPQTTIWRWREAFQNDFAARMQWTVESDYEKGIHEPVIQISTETELHVTAGESVSIDASKSYDLNNRELDFHWFVYEEAGTCSTPVTIEDCNHSSITVQIPESAETGTIHLILEVKNKAVFPVTAYQRILLYIESMSLKFGVTNL